MIAFFDMQLRVLQHVNIMLTILQYVTLDIHVHLIMSVFKRHDSMFAIGKRGWVCVVISL